MQRTISAGRTIDDDHVVKVVGKGYERLFLPSGPLCDAAIAVVNRLGLVLEVVPVVSIQAGCSLEWALVQ